MEVSTEVRDGAVTFIKAKITELDDRKSVLIARHDKSLEEIRQQRYLYVKLLQDACPHTSKKVVDSYNFHNNVDESYNECETCGKHL